MHFNYADHFISIDGLNVRYWDEGKGPVLLFVHGLGVSIETWAWNLEELSKSHRVIAFDIPGFGKSARPTQGAFFSIEFISQFIRHLLDALNVQKVNIIGNSMGGMISTYFALKSLDLVEKIILVDSIGFGREVAWTISLSSVWPIGELFTRIDRRSIRQIAKSLICNGDLIDDDFVEMMYQMAIIPGTKEAFLKIIRMGANLRGLSVEFTGDDLKKLTIPVLVIWGKKDRALPVKHAEKALSIIPDCRVVVFDNAGHAPQMDRPSLFNQILLEFLDLGFIAVEKTSSSKKIFSL